MMANTGSIQIGVVLKNLIKDSRSCTSYSKLMKSFDVSFMEHLLASLSRQIRPNWVNNFKINARFYEFNVKIVTYVTNRRLEVMNKFNSQRGAKKRTFEMLKLIGIEVDPYDYISVEISRFNT